MKVNTPKFRVSFPAVFEQTEYQGKKFYSVMALFPKDADLSQLKEQAEKAVIEKWGADKNKWPKNLRSPFRDQSEKAYAGDDGTQKLPKGHEEGAIFMNFKSNQRPSVVDQNVQEILDQNEFYAGCWAIASVQAYAYDHMGNRGVSFGLGNIQKVGDGEPLGGRTRPEDDFKPIETAGSSQGESTDSSANSIFN